MHRSAAYRRLVVRYALLLHKSAVARKYFFAAADTAYTSACKLGVLRDLGQGYLARRFCQRLRYRVI